MLMNTNHLTDNVFIKDVICALSILIDTVITETKWYNEHVPNTANSFPFIITLLTHKIRHA